jgi:WD40 repeat protein/DNA-binding CsgD family transcriptional regulator/tRNA A-37 threonylcarbamoyl transferase component Bud32
MTILNGQTLKGYDIHECIGQGAFGAVYRAYQPVIDREVAIKVILPQYANQPDFIRRFEVEAQLVARLEHLHIVPLYDYWRDPDGAYLVMRYLRGGSLKDWITQGALDPGETLRLVEQIAQALAVAHRHGVVHRDIKPSNILLDEERNAYLADFGIAKVLGGEPSVEGLRGTLDYVSPEQIRSQPVTAQTDVYALGIVLYEMLTGTQPFSPSSTPAELLHKHLETPVPDVKVRRTELPDAVNDVIQTATAKTPTERYPDAPGLARALREALAAAELPLAIVEQPLIEPLTDRELDVLRLMAEGLSHGEIAQKLVLAVTTVKWYAQEIYGKLGVSSRRQAVVVGQRLGLLEGAAERRDIALPDWMVGHNPYKGLAAFQQADAPDFFGRETLVEQLVSRLQDTNGLARFLAVVGPSGSGKSSVVRAGLLPVLKQGVVPGSDNWFVVDVLPGTRPLDKFEVALGRIATQHLLGIMEQLQRDAYGLVRVADLVLPEDGQLLLVIDQFEELFTLVDDPAVTRHVLDLIYAAVTDPRSRVRVIITLRADFYDRPLMYPDFSELVRRRTEVVVPLTLEELGLAIVKPAEMAGVTVEPGLVAALVAEVHEQPGTLPLLEYALTELFDRRQGRTMMLAAYQAIGGALGVLTRQADEVYEDLSDAEQDTARQGFLRLVTLGEGTEDVRRRVLVSELSAITTPRDGMQEVLDLFGEYRLLTFDRDPATREPTVEVAHEALIQRWERLRGWIDASRADIRQQRLLAAASAEWEHAGRERSYLLGGSRLAQFEDWAARTDLALTPGEREFLDTSVVEQRAQQARRRRFRRMALAAVSAVAVVMTVLALWANSQRSRAEDEKQNAETAREGAQRQAAILLAAQAESELESGFYDRAVLLALEALENYPYTPQAEHALGQAVSYDRALQQYTGHTSAVTSVDWSPDGTRIASSSVDNTVHIWNPTTGQPIMVINLPKGITGNIVDMALAVKWSPDGKQLLTVSGDRFWLGSQDFDLILWDATTGEQVAAVEIPNQAEPAAGEGVSTSAVHYTTGAAAAFAPNSGHLATVGGDNTALIWDAALTQQELVLSGHEDAVNGVAWSPDGTRLATASEDGTARIWDAQSGEERLVLAGHAGAVNQVIWSPDGTQLATAGKDGTVRLWDTQSGQMVQMIEPGAGIVWSLSWSRDGSLLVTGTDDAQIRLWEIDSRKVVAELNGHTKFVTYLAWFAVDNRLISAGADGKVRIWNAAPSTAILSLPKSYYGSCFFDWSSDGHYLSVTAGDWWANTAPGNLAIWDVSTGQPVVENLVPMTEDWHWCYATFSPDDQLLLAGGMKAFGDFTGASTAYVLDARTGENIRTFTVDENRGAGFVRTLAWSPDGAQVAAGIALTGTLAIWDFQTGDLLRSLTCGDWVLEAEWSPDSTRIAVNCAVQAATPFQGWIEVRDAVTFDLLFTLPDPNPPAGYMSLDWSPDGTRLLTTGGSDEYGTQDNPVRIWDGNTGEELLAILRHSGQVFWGSWSPDGSRVVTGSSDDTTRVWDAETGAELLTLSTPNNWLAIPEWSPKGDLLAVGVFSFDTPSTPVEVFRVWQSTEELIAYARECCVFRELTPEEREQFGLPERAE